MRKIGWVFLVVLLLSACSMKSAETVTPIPSITPSADAIREEERVYATLIEAHYTSDLLVIL